MSKKSPLGRPVSSESHSRNAFDRTYLNTFTFSNGLLVPTFCKFVLGHSHVRLNQRSFFRADVVTAPAFPKVPVYTDYFFVPMVQMMSSYNLFKSKVNDRISTLVNIPQRIPAIKRTALINALNILYSQADAGGYASIHGSIRLLDMLDYGITTNNVTFANSAIDEFPAVGDVNPFALMAYQKVYFDHYRNSIYEANDPYAYNLDSKIDPSTAQTSDFLNTELLPILTPRYVNAKKDFFTAIYPSLNFALSSRLSMANNLPSNLLGMTFVPSVQSQYKSGGTLIDIPGGEVVSPSPMTTSDSYSRQESFTLQNLRVAFMLEKLLRVSAFAPQHVKDQFQARFGYAPKSSYGHESQRLGSFKNNIVIGEVTSTADTGSGSSQRLGSISGKGVGAADYQKPISFDVPEDGYIIGISYTLPEFCYDSNKVDIMNQKFVPEDFALPEFEKAGLQPIYRKQLSLISPSGETEASQLKANNIILGYQNREQEFKVSINTNHGLMCAGSSHEAFVLHSNVSRVRTISSNDGVPYQYFKNTPRDIDPLFIYSYDGSEETDQFFGQIENSFACIMDKPIFGVEI